MCTDFLWSLNDFLNWKLPGNELLNLKIIKRKFISYLGTPFMMFNDTKTAKWKVFSVIGTPSSPMICVQRAPTAVPMFDEYNYLRHLAETELFKMLLYPVQFSHDDTSLQKLRRPSSQSLLADAGNHLGYINVRSLGPAFEHGVNIVQRYLLFFQ